MSVGVLEPIPCRYWGTVVDSYHDLPLSNKKEWTVNICNNLGGADCEEASPPKLQTVCFHLHNIPEMIKWWKQKRVVTVTSQGGGRSERGTWMWLYKRVTGGVLVLIKLFCTLTVSLLIPWMLHCMIVFYKMLLSGKIEVITHRISLFSFLQLGVNYSISKLKV